MKISTFVVFMAQVCACFGYKKSFVEKRPRPMQNFIPEKATGRWYYIARYISCKYQGAREFTDQSKTVKLDPSGKFYDARFHYRVGDKCYGLEDFRTLEDNNCAVQFVKDRIGGLYTGERIVVATDYKSFMIEWGCLEYAMDNRAVCTDMLMNVMARTPDPSKRTRFIIDAILRKMFNLVVKDLDIMKHDNPC